MHTIRWRVVGWRIAAIIVALAASRGEARACSCVPPRPPCEAAWTADAVFTGRVTAIAKARSSEREWPLHSVQVTFEVDRPLLHATAGRTELMTGAGGGDCGYPFIEGMRYLVYATKTKSGRLTTNICMRTRGLDHAGDDLRYLTALPDGSAGARVYGRVIRLSRGASGGGGISEAPAAGLRVSLRGNIRTRDVITDEDGRFEFSGVGVGSSSIVLTPPPGFESDGERHVQIPDPRACSQQIFFIRPK